MPAKKKKQSRATKVLNWLNPTSPAKSMLVFAIVFAIVGGGIAAYKSFAFTTSNHSYTYYANNPGEITLRSGSAVRQTDSHGGLPNTYVWRLEKNAVVGANIKVFSSPITKTMQECVVFRFTYGTSNNHLYFYDGSLISTAYAGSYTYRTACGPPRSVNFPGTFDEKILNYGPGDLYIKSISVVF
ncbi:MAG TPA: hypothetical protein VLF90_00120 [Patescibacteria group bacterium]|nr:hypothetical protein [Patescibacteria group bacterium]